MNKFSVHQLKSYLGEIKSNIGGLSYQEVVIALDKAITSVPILLTKFDSIYQFKEEGFVRDRTILYRARPNENKPTKNGTMLAPWQNVDEISIISEINRVART